ncbi:MAG TPA: LysE family translocator [Actinomycetes bacterium]|nr:LysE family translocator [Actinomycetes bacterium]
MPETSTLALFAVAAVTLLLIPGPAVLYIVTRSVDQGRAAGLASVCGVHVGTLLHVTAAALGLSALLVSSATAYDTVRWLGAAYLVWLGVRRLLARDENVPEAVAGPDARRVGLGRIFAQGVVVNVLNPKTALFFFAFLPQFVDTSRGSVPFQVVVFGFAFVLLGLLSDGAYAMLASTGAGWLRRRPGVAKASRLVSGGVLISLGVTTALAGSRSSTR